MITSQSEKWLHQEYEDDRCEALEDASGFTDAELSDLEVTRTQGGGVNDPETYLIDSSPVDPESEATPDAIDIRQIPGHD
jgi:hypothetical protein